MKKKIDKWSDNMPIKKQVDVLANFLMNYFPRRIGDDGSEGAIECAVKLLGEYYKKRYPPYINS